MARPYFRQVPNFDYVSREPGSKISDYTRVKNFFKRAKIREDIFENAAFFEKYQIKGDDRPDNVAFEIYNDQTLDWVILLANNVINIQTEWPMKQAAFDSYVIEKYGDYESLYQGIHHYETVEVKDGNGVIIMPAGLTVSEDYTFRYYDETYQGMRVVNDAVIPVSNYDHELKIENDKRNIFILKQNYLNLVLDDIENIMEYKKGSSQYVTETLKRADNIKLTS